MHFIAGVRAQLKPCRFITEIFLCGDTGPDWAYILWGVVFGFQVTNLLSEINYDIKFKEIRNKLFREIIDQQLLKELDQGMISQVEEKPSCIHNIFCVPKGTGGMCVIDCSRPKGKSINNHTEEVSTKFKYNSVDNVVEFLEVGDFMSTIDLKDAYRALAIHPSDRTKQGLIWNFKKADGTPVYLVDNRLCMGLSSNPYIFSKMSDFIVRCATREQISRVVNYLDDFCIISSNK